MDALTAALKVAASGLGAQSERLRVVLDALRASGALVLPEAS